jgi:disulfide bond formation protein DsbB
MYQVLSQSSAILTLLGLVVALVGLGLLWSGRGERVWEEVGHLLPVLIVVVSIGATVGSLLYSEVLGFEPCRLCWYQRIAMYPIAFLSALALWRRDLGLMWYFRLQATVGAAIGAYHYLTQILEFLDGGSCSATAPCTLKYVNQFGFVSIPFMAACCFVLIAVAAHYVVKFQGDNA